MTSCLERWAWILRVSSFRTFFNQAPEVTPRSFRRTCPTIVVAFNRQYLYTGGEAAGDIEARDSCAREGDAPSATRSKDMLRREETLPLFLSWLVDETSTSIYWNFERCSLFKKVRWDGSSTSKHQSPPQWTTVLQNVFSSALAGPF